jgi:YD repeat-containing protein
LSFDTTARRLRLAARFSDGTDPHWEMRFREGVLALLSGCHREGQTGSLVERRDARGNRVSYIRDASGRLLTIESEGQRISFEYDERKRIVRAYDTTHKAVVYTYDDAGRLIQAAASNGIVREYAYSERDELVVVREPGRIVQNWFDDFSRLVRQGVRSSPEDPDPYMRRWPTWWRRGKSFRRISMKATTPRRMRYAMSRCRALVQAAHSRCACHSPPMLTSERSSRSCPTGALNGCATLMLVRKTARHVWRAVGTLGCFPGARFAPDTTDHGRSRPIMVVIP